MPSTGSNPTTSSTSTTDGSLTCKKRKLTSIVWNEFEKVIIDGQDYAILERKGYGKVQIGGFTFDQDISREKLACAIILHEYPLSIVEHAGFRDFASSLQPLFKMVSRNTIKDDIMKIYEFEKGKMSSYLEKLETRMAIITNMWTSNQKKGYKAITVHYIDEFWLLHHHIVRKLSTITVDNCSTHVLNLIVKEGLDVIRVKIEKIHESVAYWLAIPSRVEKFEDAARQLCLPCNKKLCLDCKTRWNSTYLMLSIAITYKDVFPHLKQCKKLYTTVPSEKEWNLAREICERLKLFYNITKLFSGLNYPTANTFFIKVCEIKEALVDWLICSNEVVSIMASSMSEASSEIGKIRQLCYDLLSEYQSKSKMGQQNSSHGASSVQISLT
ncbi:putative AC transposase [Vitis vinifera]|uniref:Putative AC transposase n=1 Tax=Vitis vinifera TaxID=29760 RepID=A0A438IFJ8_VITVI|nr:putative AC transposase [Vitis vinifera]